MQHESLSFMMKVRHVKAWPPNGHKQDQLISFWRHWKWTKYVCCTELESDAGWESLELSLISACSTHFAALKETVDQLVKCNSHSWAVIAAARCVVHTSLFEMAGKYGIIWQVENLRFFRVWHYILKCFIHRWLKDKKLRSLGTILTILQDWHVYRWGCLFAILFIR